jgi:integrase
MSARVWGAARPESGGGGAHAVGHAATRRRRVIDGRCDGDAGELARADERGHAAAGLQAAHSLAVRQFLDRMQRAPEALTDEHVRGYFLYLREHKKLAPSSINLAVHALRFFFVHTLQRDWPAFGLLRVHKPRMLPVVLSPGEVRAVLSAVRHPPRRMALCTIYALACAWAKGCGCRAATSTPSG